MKTGRLAENILKRSVWKWVKKNREDIVTGAGIGVDCAIFSLSDDMLQTAAVHAGVVNTAREISLLLVTSLNMLAASGAQPTGIMLSWILPQDLEEKEVQQYMRVAQAFCESNKIEIAGIQMQVAKEVVQTVLSVTAVGSVAKKKVVMTGGLKPGMDIVVSKWIGMEGSLRIADSKREELLHRYPADMIETVVKFEDSLSIIPEAATAIRSGVCSMYCPGEGGIYGALWEMAEGAGVGLDIELKKLPIKQETIEICEFFEISPYELLAGGCLLMAAPNGFDLVRALEKEGIPAVVVGKATMDHDRVVNNEEERRFLEPPKTDEIHKVLS